MERMLFANAAYILYARSWVWEEKRKGEGRNPSLLSNYSTYLYALRRMARDKQYDSRAACSMVA